MCPRLFPCATWSHSFTFSYPNDTLRATGICVAPSQPLPRSPDHTARVPSPGVPLLPLSRRTEKCRLVVIVLVSLAGYEDGARCFPTIREDHCRSQGKEC